MKLTKGKITKLYNKTKQSCKKRRNNKISNKNKSFRKKHTINLAKKTLKKYFLKKQRGSGSD